MIGSLNPINLILLVLLGIVLVYVISRVISTAVFMSWWDVKSRWWKKRKQDKEGGEDL